MSRFPNLIKFKSSHLLPIFYQLFTGRSPHAATSKRPIENRSDFTEDDHDHDGPHNLGNVADCIMGSNVLQRTSYMGIGT
jgi:hypothetical protein